MKPVLCGFLIIKDNLKTLKPIKNILIKYHVL